MENFVNEIIDTNFLPRQEEVIFNKLNPKYIFVLAFNIAVFLFCLIAALFFVFYFDLGSFSDFIFLCFSIGSAAVIFLTILLTILSFKKKGFAFRTHDVLYRDGVLATNTIIIPYNRIQHIAVHEGLVAAFFGLAKIEIFTASGNSGDIQIPGIEIEEAEKIKQLLMSKIQKRL
jgi:membrane protein YdbS with pleckstrin-like domain